MLLRVHAVLPIVLFVLGLQLHGLSAKESEDNARPGPATSSGPCPWV